MDLKLTHPWISLFLDIVETKSLSLSVWISLAVVISDVKWEGLHKDKTQECMEISSWVRVKFIPVNVCRKIKWFVRQSIQQLWRFVGLISTRELVQAFTGNCPVPVYHSFLFWDIWEQQQISLFIPTKVFSGKCLWFSLQELYLILLTCWEGRRTICILQLLFVQKTDIKDWTDDFLSLIAFSSACKTWNV